MSNGGSMFELQFKNITYTVKTMDEVFTIIGEQDGSYSIKYIKE